jgi:DNA-binding transcriptional regulator YhcF (GntR family)
MEELRINKADTLPIHIQLTEQIKYHIESGTWSPGARLPTVRDLAERLQLNYNTIRAAYVEMERQGYVLTERGRGTFVVATPPRHTAHQNISVLDIIDEALAQAKILGVPPAEFARMAYTRAKLPAPPPDAVHLLFIECNTADLYYFAEKITRATGISPTPCLFDDLRQRDAAFLDQFDIIVTPLFHFEELKQVVGTARPIMGLLVEPAYESVIVPLMHLPAKTKVGLICATPESAETMRSALSGIGLTHLKTITAGVDHPADVTNVFETAEDVYVSRHGAHDRKQPWPHPERVRQFTEEFDPLGLRLLRRQIASISAAASQMPTASIGPAI